MIGCARGAVNFPPFNQTQGILHKYENIDDYTAAEQTEIRAMMEDLHHKFYGADSTQDFKCPSSFTGINVNLRLWQSSLLDEIDAIFLRHFPGDSDIGCMAAGYCDALDAYSDDVTELIIEKSKSTLAADDAASLDRLAATVAYHLARHDDRTPLPLMTKSVILRCNLLLSRSANAISEVSTLGVCICSKHFTAHY
jgi:hypothetical protein